MFIFLSLSFVIFSMTSICIARVFNKLNTKHCDCSNKLDKKTIVMTGANTGIGLASAINLSWRNPAKIIIGCRNVDQTKQIISNLKKNKKFNHQTTVLIKELDLLNLNNVRNFAEDIINSENRIDILILNAGAGCYFGKHITQDLLEQQFQSNHLSHFLLTNLLKQKMIDTSIKFSNEPSRIIVTSSAAHWLGTIDLDNIATAKNYIQHPFLTYSNTKLANILFTKQLALNLKQDSLYNKLIVTCFSPGTIYTNGIKNNQIWYLKIFLLLCCFIYNRTAFDAAENIIHLSLSSDYKTLNGSYFTNCQLSEPSPKAKNLKLAQQLWKLSETICDNQLFRQ